MNSIYQLRNVLQKNSPTILTGLSVAGLIGTAIMAVKATPRAIALIEREEALLVDPLSKKDIIRVAWRCYVPAALMGLASCACIIGANSVHTRRHAALAGVYSLSEKALREYQKKVEEKIGTPKAKEIKSEIAADRVKDNPIDNHEVYITGRGDTLCYDSLSGRYFKSDIECIRQALNKLSRDLLSENFIALNDVYSELGLKQTTVGDMLGWYVEDGLITPHFTSQLTDSGIPCLVLDYETEPRYNNYN
jgi:hypothetical protein